MAQSVQVIGVGQEFRGDDGVGLLVARGIRARNLPRVTVREEPGAGLDLLTRWPEAALVIMVDAMHAGVEPGTVCRFEVESEPLPARLFVGASSHSWGVAESIELARVLRQLPPRLIVYGIEGKNFDPGTGLSPEVSQAAQEVVQRIVKEITSCIDDILCSSETAVLT
jgi:hydrogenase maturation protease